MKKYLLVCSLACIILLYLSSCIIPRAKPKFTDVKAQSKTYIDNVFKKNIDAFDELVLQPIAEFRSYRSDIVTDEISDQIFAKQPVYETYIYNINCDIDNPSAGIEFQLDTTPHKTRICYTATGKELAHLYNPRDNEIEWINNNWYIEYYYYIV